MSIEAMKMALEALKLAKNSHGVYLASDPPKDAWKYHMVDSKLSEAIVTLRQAIEDGTETAFATKKWVGLTDEEIFDSVRPFCQTDEVAKMFIRMSLDEYRAIEAKLKEKNT
jgi:hypothetical protein